MFALITNPVLIAGGTGLLIAQIAKIFTYRLWRGKWDISLLWSASGMPSSHTSFVMGAATMIGWQEGWGSPLFALSVIVSVIIMYDAMGVRRAVGDQAELLNYLMELRDTEDAYSHLLLERVGHTPPQVFFGAVLGILIGTILYHV